MVPFCTLLACTGPGPALALAAAALLHALTGAAEGALLDEVVADYLEDAERPRPVAEIRGELLRRGEGLYLRVVVSAEGPRVDAVPGLAGVRGHNLRTAEELHRLLRDGELRFVLRGGEPAAELEGTVHVARAGRLPERSIGKDGALRLRGETEAEWPLDVGFEGGPLSPGTWRAYVMVGDVPRLRAVVDAGALDPRIVDLQSLGQFHDPRSPR